MKRFLQLSLLLLTFISLSGYSQIMDVDFQSFYDDFDQLKRFNEYKEISYDGSPYLNEDFEAGKIILADGKEYKRILLRYNVFYDRFEFSRDGQALAIEKDPQFSCFFIGDRIFFYKKFKYKDDIQEGYLEQVVEGDYSLYLKHDIVLREGEEAGAFQETRKPTFVPQKPSFLIGSKDKDIISVKGSKDFLNKFNDLEELIEEYTGSKKLKLKTEQDYIELVNYLNSQI